MTQKDIEFVLNNENISHESVITIGDGINDIEMLKKYNGVTVDGAIPDVIAVSAYQYPNVSDLIQDIL
jgi:hydroxymethylpyrimidine pyrophosphatase-like HAD family hydrolase